VIQKLYDGILLKQWDLLVGSIVFRPGLMAGPVQSSGFDQVTGLAGSNFFLKKSKRCRFSKKKNKNQRVATEFLTGSCHVNWVAGSTGSHRVFSYPIFSSTRPGSSLGSVGSRVDPPGPAWKFQSRSPLVISIFSALRGLLVNT
jgi:hypothetical protein